MKIYRFGNTSSSSRVLMIIAQFTTHSPKLSYSERNNKHVRKWKRTKQPKRQNLNMFNTHTHTSWGYDWNRQSGPPPFAKYVYNVYNSQCAARARARVPCVYCVLWCECWVDRVRNRNVHATTTTTQATSHKREKKSIACDGRVEMNIFYIYNI